MNRLVQTVCVGVLILAGVSAAASESIEHDQIVKLPDGSLYEGAMADGLLHGSGRITYPNGDVFKGRFERGLMSGSGQFTGVDGTRYVGDFQVDGPSGSGEIHYEDGAHYRGEWFDWRSHGQGAYTSPEGDLYEGTFHNGRPDGEFRVLFADGDSYDGGLAGWAFEGIGTYVTSGGATYTGSFAAGAPSEVVVTQPNGDSYEGAMTYWRYSGRGTLTTADGARYEGQFDRGRYHGDGELRQADGRVYVGQFANGLFHGEGSLSLASTEGEDVLSGTWKSGYFTGEGWRDYVDAGLARPDTAQVLFDQQRMLDKALAEIPQGVAGREDLFTLLFASYAEQDVFMREAEFVSAALQARYPMLTGSLVLVNNPRSTTQYPLATQTNLRYAIHELAQRMNVDEDVLLVYITSHGSEAGEISVSFPRVGLDDLSGSRLREMLDEAGIEWRVVMVSACYSGSFIAPLAHPRSLIMTSSRSDRRSFGCSDDAELTYFGQAFFQDALPVAESLDDAFFSARKRLSVREREEGHVPSEPQIHLGREVRAKLKHFESSGALALAGPRTDQE